MKQKRLGNKAPGHPPNKVLMPFTPMSQYLCGVLSVLEESGETPVINDCYGCYTHTHKHTQKLTATEALFSIHNELHNVLTHPRIAQTEHRWAQSVNPNHCHYCLFSFTDSNHSVCSQKTSHNETLMQWDWVLDRVRCQHADRLEIKDVLVERRW